MQFSFSPFCPVVQKDTLFEAAKCLLTAYFISNISAKNTKMRSRVSKL